MLAMLADQTAFNLGHDFAPGLKEMSNFSPSTLPSHHLDPCYGSKDGIHEISQTIFTIIPLSGSLSNVIHKQRVGADRSKWSKWSSTQVALTLLSLPVYILVKRPLSCL